MKRNMTKLDLSYHKTIWDFMNDDSFVRIVIGPVGSGKSTGVICGEIMRRALMQEPSPVDNTIYFKALVVRNTMPDLKKTTIKTWNSLYPPNIGKWRNNPPFHHFKRKPTKKHPGIDFLIEFMGLDTIKDAGKLLSYEGTLIAFNECKEIRKDIIDQATARVGRYPSMKQGGIMPTWYGIIADTNPYSAGHWMDALEKDMPTGWKYFRQPPAVFEMEKVKNGWKSIENEYEYIIPENKKEYIHTGGGSIWAVNPKAENLPYLPINHSLDPNYKEELRKDPKYLEQARLRAGGYYPNLIKGKDKSYIQIYVQGKNGSLTSDHAVIPEFNAHTMVSESIEYNELLPLHCGIDFGAGTLNPAAVFGQLDIINGRWHILKECVCPNMGLVQFVNQVLLTIKENFLGVEDLRVWGDPAGLQKDGISMKTYFDHMRTQGLYANPAPSNEIDIRIECIKTPMLRFSNGKPGILFSPNCKILIEALSEKWCYKRLNVPGEDRYDDKPSKDHPWSDVADALGYMLSGGGEHGALSYNKTNQLDFTILDNNWEVL